MDRTTSSFGSEVRGADNQGGRRQQLPGEAGIRLGAHPYLRGGNPGLSPDYEHSRLQCNPWRSVGCLRSCQAGMRLQSSTHQLT